MASFAEKLKALRGQNHMTQAQLAAALKLHVLLLPDMKQKAENLPMTN